MINLRPGIVCAALLCVGCVSTHSLAPSKSNSTAPIYEQGVAVLTSTKTNVVMVRVLTSEFRKDRRSEVPALYVAVRNGSGQAVDFSTDNIAAFSGKDRVRVYTYEDLRKRIQRDAALLAMATAMNSASQTMAASMPQQTTTSGMVTTRGAGGYSTGTYSGVATTYNPQATAIAQANINAQTTAQMGNIAATRDVLLSDTTSMLRRNTVAADQVVGGVVKLYAEDVADRKPLKVLVTIAGEAHEFLFDVGMDQAKR